MSEVTRHLPPLATLTPFEAAHRLGSFTRAAEELHLSQASISRRVRELERDLGVALFERNRYDVTPTAAGDRLAASVRLTLGELSSAAALLRRENSDSSSLTIFSDLSLATVLVAPVIGDLRRLHPELEIRVIATFEPIDATREHFDIGLQNGRQGVSAYEVEVISEETIFPVCSPDIAAELPRSIGPTELARLPLLHLADIDPTWINWRRFLDHFGVDETEVAHGMVFTSYQVCLDVAERGEGVALGWEHTVQPRLDAGRLVRLSTLSIPNGGVINAYKPRSVTPNPHADEFLEMLRVRLAT